MRSITQMRLFQKAATGIFIVFMALMLIVCITAYSRRSGATRQDMAQAQMARLEASAVKKAAQETTQAK